MQAENEGRFSVERSGSSFDTSETPDPCLVVLAARVELQVRADVAAPGLPAPRACPARARRGCAGARVHAGRHRAGGPHRVLRCGVDLARGAGPCATRAARPDCLCARRRARATPDCYGSAGCVRRRRLARVPSLVPRRAPWVSPAAPASARRRTCRCGRVPAARCRSRPHSARALCDGAHVGGAARSRSRHNATDRALPATHGRPGRHPAPGQQPAGRRVRGDPASDAPSSQVAPRPRRGPQGGVGVRRRLSAACCSAARQARLPAGVPAATAPRAPPPLQRPATRERARRRAGG